MSTTPDVEQEVVTIRRLIAESDKFAAEQRKLTVEAEKFSAEQRKLMAEADKLMRDRGLAPWQIAATFMGTGAALFAAGAAFIRLLG